MTEPILSANYWARRIQDAKDKGEFHHSIFRCPLKTWQSIEEKHARILSRHIRPDTSVFDAGCGYGRLLNLMPTNWRGYYEGVDLSPEFVQIARQNHPGKRFYNASLLDLSGWYDKQFEFAVLISIRPMMIRNLGQGVWDKMEVEIRKVAANLLYLEYDPNCEGFLE